MARIGIYGGSFNPPHTGHLQAARYALQTMQLEKLLIIPANTSPGKALCANMPTAEQRLQMTCLAFANEPGMTVLDIEIQRGGVSYTADTVTQIGKMFPNDELVLFMGTDMFLSFLKWYRPEQIIKLAELAVFYRGEYEEQQKVLAQKETLEKRGAKVHLVCNPVHQISSTDLRRMLIFGGAENWLCPSVADYIQSHQLFGTGRCLRKLPIQALEQAVTGLISPNRVAHVRGCRDTAAELAARWGANVEDAERAALLHDITKALGTPLQLQLCRHYNADLCDFSMQNPKTLHARTGSLIAERVFGENPAVVAAIDSHTTGKANMNVLEKIIYVADYVEPNRDFPGVLRLRELAYEDLDGALKHGLEITLDMLRRQGKQISSQSLEALADLDTGTKSRKEGR